MDGVRAYLLALRRGRRVSQEAFGKAIGLSRRSIIEWEKGRSDELKGSPLVRAVVFLRGSWGHIVELVEQQAGVERGEELAREVLTPAQQQMIDPFLESDEGTRAILWGVYEVSKNPLLRERIKAYLDGLTDRLDLDDVSPAVPRRRWFRRKPRP